MIFPDVFSRHDIRSLPVPERDAAAASLGLPYFVEFLDSVHRVGAVSPGSLVRQHLLDLLIQGSFTVVSPVTGRVLNSGPSLLLVDKAVLFAFPDEPDLMLGVGDVSQGYPICALLVLRFALFLPISDSTWGFADRHLGWAAQAIRDTGWRLAPVSGPPVIVTGDTNFAHVAWNQLSALHDLLRHDLPSNLRVLATQQPLGPIRDILPELPPWPVEELPDTALQAQNRPGLLFMPLGATLLTEALAARLHDYAQRRLSVRAQAVDAVLAAAGPVLWVSVRTRNRTAINQHELLAKLGGSFLAAVPDGAVLVDGFSRAADLAAYPEYHRAEADAVLAADAEAADALAAALSVGAPGRVHSAVGLTVSDSIALGRRASLYFCHHGTVQHKVGWFNATPGVVHCNRAILQQAPAAWVAAQSAVAVAPVYLPPATVVDAPPGAGSEYSTLLRHDNYLVVDVPAAVAAVMELAGAMGLLPGTDAPRRAGLLARYLSWIAPRR